MRKLSIGETRVTDMGLVHLKGLARLEHLILRGQGKRISGVGLAQLHGLKALKVLDLGFGTKITKDDIRAIKQALPNLKVLWNE